MEYKSTIPSVFKDIDNSADLVRYLCDDSRRLSNSEYIYHYTTINSLIKIIKSRRLHLAKAADMNDKLEFKNGDITKWNNIFFTSFMTEDKENIGMWSMYAQPWEKGVKIAIPSTVVRNWIHSISELEEISVLDYSPTGKKVQLDSNQLNITSVVYSNTDSITGKNFKEKICWSNVVNNNLRDSAHMKELTGYVKDMAWSYEKEIRIRVEFNNQERFDKVSINLPNEVIESMIITESPLFKGDLFTELQKETKRQLSIDYSLFKDRLIIKTICQSCEFKQGN